jgi:hypothetical protein
MVNQSMHKFVWFTIGLFIALLAWKYTTMCSFGLIGWGLLRCERQPYPRWVWGGVAFVHILAAILPFDVRVTLGNRWQAKLLPSFSGEDVHRRVENAKNQGLAEGRDFIVLHRPGSLPTVRWVLLLQSGIGDKDQGRYTPRTAPTEAPNPPPETIGQGF